MSAVIHLVSNGLMLAGLLLMGVGWYRIHRARGELVTDGVYAWVRHPQYAGLFLSTIGMLVQWPTIITVLTWPALMLVYYRLARREEREAEARFGDAYARWKASVPMFVPRIGFGRGAAPKPDPGDEHGHGGLPARVGVPEARLRLALLTAGQPVVDQHERGPRQHRDDGRPLDQHPDRAQEEPGVLRVTHPGVHAVGDQLPPRSVDAVPPDPHEKEPRQHEPVAHQMNDG